MVKLSFRTLRFLVASFFLMFKMPTQIRIRQSQIAENSTLRMNVGVVSEETSALSLVVEDSTLEESSINMKGGPNASILVSVNQVSFFESH